MKNYNFDEALQALNDINERLSAGNLTLEETLELFAQGIDLALFCRKTLTAAESKVKLLSEKLDGDLELTDFNE